MARQPKFSGVTPRRRPIREVRQHFLIVCEGKRSEPNYFRRFARPWVTVDVLGLGVGPERLVYRAIKEAKKPEWQGSRVWCVFDRDEVPVAQFEMACDLARKNGFDVAYSNPCFELWLLLHFEECRTPLGSRREYDDRLSRYLARDYERNDQRVFDMLETRQSTAIKRAAGLLATYTPCSPCHDDPSTTVHLLVQELLKREQR